jgi:enediyne biosynthesis thioesterase
VRNYEYRHLVCLEETNTVGNVYFTHYVSWQGRCREMFLRDHTPELLNTLGHGITLVTTRVSCSYYHELSAFDEVIVRMIAGALTPSRLKMVFQYLRVLPGAGEELVADGEQEIAAVRRDGSRVEPVMLPQTLRDAVERYIEASAGFPATSLAEWQQ